MRRLALGLVALGFFTACAASVHEQRATLASASRALGATDVTSIEFTGHGIIPQAGQSKTPGDRWPRYDTPRFTRAINFETASMRDTIIRTQGENPPRGGGVQPVRGEQRQVFLVSGDHAWNVEGDAPAAAPLALAERQLQLWTTPHGFIRAAFVRGTVHGDTIRVAVPGRFTARGSLNAEGLLEKVEATVPNPVAGDFPVEITYAEYKAFGPVKFPTRIRQSHGGRLSLDLTVTEVKVNAPLDVSVPEPVRTAVAPYATVKSDKVADGVWYLTGGSHHSVVIEMADYVIVVEGPLNDQRALAVIAETRRLAPVKPIRYVVASHHHFDHSGGLRAFSGEGITLITHESNRAFFERAFAAGATVSPDHLSRAGRRGGVEGMGDKRTLTDGARAVDIHLVRDNAHADGMLMVHLPGERLLVEADAFTPLAPNAPVPTPPDPFAVNLADNIARLGLAVDQILPLHGRIVPLAELHRTIGR